MVRDLWRVRSQPTIVSQGVRYALAGALVAAVYLTTTVVLADLVGLPFQIALICGWLVAVILHFALQRMFVWASRAPFVLDARRQMARYLLVVLAQYAITALATSLLPPALNVSATLVYLLTVAAIALTNFIVFRSRVFHATD
ncbi:MAG TPA: GtrA family protein [Solirubrobacteraceae bacterium]|nr:GtrA family protein [Solirubrobacteraceae bacterium]